MHRDAGAEQRVIRADGTQPDPDEAFYLPDDLPARAVGQRERETAQVRDKCL
jgi:hypothetical protein